jgi:MtrB/PioB family decaheme-associated outer membrane protein
MRKHTVMRRFSTVLCLTVLAAAWPAGSHAQAPQAGTGESPAPPAAAGASGWIDFGARATSVSGDEDRFNRYRDVGSGGFVERFQWGRATETQVFRAAAANAGRRDQRFEGLFEQTGRFRAAFMWDQIPLRISSDTRSPYQIEGPGILRVPDSIQIGIQEGRNTLADIVPLAGIFETAHRRHTATGSFLLHATPEVDVRGRFSTAQRRGFVPWGASFGLNLAVEVPAPIENRTTDARMEVEWTRGRSLLRVNYDGSWFQNDIERLTWDNPIRFTDTMNPLAYLSGAGTSTGRMALAPSNQMHTVGATGSMAMPHRSRLTATVAFGANTQNAEILPHTINSALVPVELPRERTDARIRIGVANVSFTSRPWRAVNLTGRYRLHDRRNTTPHFEVVDRVRMDQQREAFDPTNLGKHGPEFHDISRHRVDLEAAYSPIRFTAVRLGYGHTRTSRTHRVFELTTENTVRASIDTTGNQLVSFRAQVERSSRDGRDFNPQALIFANEQPGMRHFDVASRDRTRFTGMATVTPLDFLGLNAAVTVGNDDFPESPFGLRDNRHRVYSVGTDMTGGPAVLSLSFARERYTTFQLSRQANPGAQFNDPTRDWGADANERVNSVLSRLELNDLFPRTQVRLTYDFSRSRTRYLYELGTPPGERTLPEGSPVSTLLPVTQLPPVSNGIHSSQLDTRYFLTPRIAVGLVYWYERYRVQDFALGDETIRRIDLPNGLLMYYRYRPYDAHSGWLRLTYLF